MEPGVAPASKNLTGRDSTAVLPERGPTPLSVPSGLVQTPRPSSACVHPTFFLGSPPPPTPLLLMTRVCRALLAPTETDQTPQRKEDSPVSVGRKPFFHARGGRGRGRGTQSRGSIWSVEVRTGRRGRRI